MGHHTAGAPHAVVPASVPTRCDPVQLCPAALWVSLWQCKQAAPAAVRLPLACDLDQWLCPVGLHALLDGLQAGGAAPPGGLQANGGNGE
jgi:hypothetical protein